MPAAKTNPTRTTSLRLNLEDERRLAELVQHFSASQPDGLSPVTPSDVLRVALFQLHQTELGNRKKPSK